VGTDDALVTTSIEVTQYVKRKMDALKAHRTQLGTIAPFLAMPEELHVLALGTEHYVLARSSVPSPEGIENDLLLGL
jgi:LmbE family N-acetylglucosaminyl deacetylase